MLQFIKKNLKRAKLAYLWITRILFAPSKFNVPLFTRIRYAIFGGFIGDQYELYGLKNNKKSEYLSEFDWYRSRWINEPFDSMLNNKIACNEVLKHYAQVPQILFVKNKGRLVSFDNPDEHRPVDDVLDVLVLGGSVFMKPLGAGKGKGVHRLECINGQFLLDNVSVDRSAMAEKLNEEDGWFLSEGVEQHPQLAALYSQTSNTIRIITMRDPETGILKVFFAVLRIGTSETVPVDNGSRGGLVAKIDLETGILSEARTLWSQEVFEKHPDSGHRIEGLEIPDWVSVKEMILELANALPYLQFIAWDVLISADGPFIIEANTSSGVNIIQLWGPQRNGELGNFYRAHRVIK